ncbi:MAG: response regulator [Chloroflexales bacterium]|nr:response regulator [Chloroflexales bacterium]
MARVLLVDDVYTARSMVERVLSRVGGYEVRSVGSGAEAVAVALATPPDVIILDISMAGMDGPTTLRELRARGVTCPIVAYTARSERRPGEFVAQGFDAYISKNGNLGDLLTRVREIVGTDSAG